MNGSVLAALVVAALIVVALILKNRASQKKPVESGIDEQPVVLLPETEEVPTEAAESSAVREDVTAAGAATETGASEPEIRLVIEETAEAIAETEEPLLASEPVMLAADELELVDLAPEYVPADPNEDLAVVESVLAPPAVAEAPVGGGVEQEAVPGAEEPSTAKANEDEAPVSEPLVAVRPEPMAEATGIADRMASPAPGATVLPVVRLTLDAYSARLNGLEERQRSMLTQAIGRRDDQLRDRLQRELVVMNDKLALLADSYVEEVACYQQVLEALEQVRSTVGDGEDLQAAIEQLQAGEAAAAEEFLAGLDEQPPPLAGRVAYGRGLLAESRVDLQKALELYRQGLRLELATAVRLP